MSSEHQSLVLRLRQQTTNPLYPNAGYMYYDTGNNRMMRYDGAKWTGAAFTSSTSTSTTTSSSTSITTSTSTTSTSSSTTTSISTSITTSTTTTI